MAVEQQGQQLLSKEAIHTFNQNGGDWELPEEVQEEIRRVIDEELMREAIGSIIYERLQEHFFSSGGGYIGIGLPQYMERLSDTYKDLLDEWRCGKRASARECWTAGQ